MLLQSVPATCSWQTVADCKQTVAALGYWQQPMSRFQSCCFSDVGAASPPPPPASRRSWADGLFRLRRSASKAPRPADAADDFSPLGASLPRTSSESAASSAPPLSCLWTNKFATLYCFLCPHDRLVAGVPCSEAGASGCQCVNRRLTPPDIFGAACMCSSCPEMPEPARCVPG